MTLAVEAKKRIRGKAIRVVSMPSMDIFKQQSREYRESILPPGIENRIAIEAGSRMSWG
ncbi:transketolase-like TK C-terminal-containing protein, partial [Blautia wexlerae]|uniref:transketolase-like TK C-terminal-containing protein n=1 Tax=Blautia wexlerae TaxID=418240 RepID=UPI003F7B9464